MSSPHYQFPNEITQDVLQKLSHISEQQIRDDISDTERELCALEREPPIRTYAAIGERKAFIAFLQRLLYARIRERYQ